MYQLRKYTRQVSNHAFQFCFGKKRAQQLRSTRRICTTKGCSCLAVRLADELQECANAGMHCKALTCSQKNSRHHSSRSVRLFDGVGATCRSPRSATAATAELVICGLRTRLRSVGRNAIVTESNTNYQASPIFSDATTDKNFAHASLR